MSAEPEPLESLIASAKADDALPSGKLDEAWTRFEGTVGAGGSPVVDVGTADAAATAATAASGTAITKGLVVSGLCVLGLATAAAVWSPSPDPAISERTPEAPVVTPAREDPPTRPATPEEPSPEVDVVDEKAATPPTEPPASRAKRTQQKRPPASKAETHTAASLAEQAQLLGRAWAQVGDGRNSSALALVAEHRRRFPRSVLAPERRACELVAKCQRGDAGAGRKANAFVARHSGSLAKRVADACRNAIERHDKARTR